MADRGICTYHFPLSEDYGADWRGNLMEALATLKAIVGRDERVVVHCGFENHLLYNVSQGHFEVGDLDGLVM